MTIDLAVVGGVVVVVLWVVPVIQARRAAKRNEIPQSSSRSVVENEYRKTWAGIIGGTALIGALVLSGQQLQETIRRENEGLLTEQFGTAVEHLTSGNEVLAVSGAYELGRIAAQNPEMKWTIMNVLGNYVERESRIRVPQALTEADEVRAEVLGAGHSKETIWFPIELQAVLSVLGKARSDAEIAADHESRQRVHLTYADLRGAWLRRLDFRGAVLVGSNLAEANLFETQLEGAILSDVRGITAEQLREAFIDETTRPPTDPPPGWWAEVVQQSVQRRQKLP